MVETSQEKTEVLVETLPYIRKFRGKTFVIKYGGNAMKNEELKQAVLRDIVLLEHVGINPVIVIGGGPQATRLMEEAGIKPVFINGLRVTDEKAIKIVDEAFSKVNEEIVHTLNKLGGKAITLKAKENNIIEVKPINKELGFVGEVKKVNVEIIAALVNQGYIPVISPIGSGPDGMPYNINADTVATHLAVALNAEKLTILTDVDSVMKEGKKVSKLTPTMAKEYIRDGIITGGMIPKVEACLYAIDHEVKKAHLINGTTLHALLLEIFTHRGIGTEITKDPSPKENGHKENGHAKDKEVKEDKDPKDAKDTGARENAVQKPAETK